MHVYNTRPSSANVATLRRWPEENPMSVRALRNALVIVRTKAGRSEKAESPKVKMRNENSFRKAACFPASAMASDRLLPETPSRSQGVAKSCGSTIGWPRAHPRLLSVTTTYGMHRTARRT